MSTFGHNSDTEQHRVLNQILDKEIHALNHRHATQTMPEPNRYSSSMEASPILIHNVSSIYAQYSWSYSTATISMHTMIQVCEKYLAKYQLLMPMDQTQPLWIQ